MATLADESTPAVKKTQTDDAVTGLHWDKRLERRGLGNLLYKVNHIALTVSDIGRSLWFYSDVLGLQQIRRPNFYRHGAWLTMGNVELHLILGPPTVPSGNDLIVGHISFESENIQEVLKRLKEMGVPFETNACVPQGDKSDGIVTQFFLRDPDGYYVELCNCDILTEFCFGDKKIDIKDYEESCRNTVSINVLGKMAVLASQAKKNTMFEDPEEILEFFDSVDSSAVTVDEEKLANLLQRTKVYGDIIQGEDEASLREILKKTDNHIPNAISYIKAKHGDNQKFQPPTFFKDNQNPVKPPSLTIEKDN